MFRLTKARYKNKIRILCYHGFSMINEEQCVPGLFIKPDIFDGRMKYLTENGYNVISLEEAYIAATTNKIEDNSVVITIDDGFYSTYSEALPILKKYNLPSTLYLTSYYFDRNCPIFTLAVNYMFWNSKKDKFDLSILDIDGLGIVHAGTTQCEESIVKISETGQAFKNNEGRINLLEKLGQATGQPYQDINESRILNLITEAELKECIQHKMEIELHTHRHIFPLDPQEATAEIEKNKNRVNALLKTPMSHFCYPSGDWSSDHWPILDQQNVKTSTTCDNGLVSSETPLHAWSRFLDSARISKIEYESELSGFTECLRNMRGK